MCSLEGKKYFRKKHISFFFYLNSKIPPLLIFEFSRYRFSFEGKVSLLRSCKSTETPHDAMAGQRKGSMKELRLLKRWRVFQRSVNYVEYQEQERMRGPVAFSSFSSSFPPLAVVFFAFFFLLL